MLEILKSRYRQKYDKNFMRVLDACYFYYETIMGKKITEHGTIRHLMEPAIIMTEYEHMIDYYAGILLSDYKNPILRKIEISDSVADELIYMLKAKYAILSYNSNHNIMNKTCKNLPWRLDFSSHYAADTSEIKQFNETEKYIEIIRDDHNPLSFRHVVYPKYDPMQNNDEYVVSVDVLDIDRISDGIYRKYDVGDTGRIEILENGYFVLRDDNKGKIVDTNLNDESLRTLLAGDNMSTYFDKNHVSAFVMNNDEFIMLNMPYNIFNGDIWDHKMISKIAGITCHNNSAEYEEVLSHVAHPSWMHNFQKLDAPSILEAHSNGHRIFTDTEIFMARNELARVEPSSHYNDYVFTGEEVESAVYEKGIEFASMPDGTFLLNTCTGISEQSVKIRGRYYTIIRNVDEEVNYLAWSDDNQMWVAIIALPDAINSIECDKCDDFYIVMRDSGTYRWAYSLDLGRATIS